MQPKIMFFCFVLQISIKQVSTPSKSNSKSGRLKNVSHFLCIFPPLLQLLMCLLVKEYPGIEISVVFSLLTLVSDMAMILRCFFECCKNIIKKSQIFVETSSITMENRVTIKISTLYKFRCFLKI